MGDLTPSDGVDRFTGLGEVYSRSRPDYPAAVLDFIMDRCGLHAGSVVADVGSGTGIAARQLAMRGIQVIGIEPNEDMRRQALMRPMPAGVPAPIYQAGQAEATGLPDGCADAIVSAQAFHWFTPDAALKEFHRLLRPDGWVVLMWNER